VVQRNWVRITSKKNVTKEVRLPQKEMLPIGKARTVSNHISNIFNKLQVADRAQAIVKARQAGLGK